MYKVIYDFLDLEDNSFLYSSGKGYPREGYSPSEERINELLGDDNKIGRPLIELVEKEPKEEELTKKTKNKGKK